MGHQRWTPVGAVAWVFVLAACGGKTLLWEPPPRDVPDAGTPVEVCNGQDDDRDTKVDETFRDDGGLYVSDEHCGACGVACNGNAAHGGETHCVLLDGAPTCAPTACDAGFALSRAGTCVPAWDHLCLPCNGDGDCGTAVSAACDNLDGAQVCTVGCDGGCPDGYGCTEGRCLPDGGSCQCTAGKTFTVACARTTPDGALCPGHAACADGVLSSCDVNVEVCDGVDNDCDGVVDGPFRNEDGYYAVDLHHCGGCGIDCAVSSAPDGDIVCGGDPTAPSCVLACPDLVDGRDVGDRLDADGDLATGCECVVSSLTDEPGPVGEEGAGLDTNCDGADGVLGAGYYVAQDGKDTAAGSAKTPFATITRAVIAATASVGTNRPRVDIYVAAGTYAETVSVPDGVRIHGGYRRDFLALDPQGFLTEVRAPTSSTAPGHAALDVRDAGKTVTLIEGLIAVGGDGAAASEPSFGVYVKNPGAKLTFRNMEVRAGIGGAGTDGNNGAAGARPMAAPTAGGAPRVAATNANHRCQVGEGVAGGTPGRNLCGNELVDGGAGARSICPGSVYQNHAQPRGDWGAGTSVANGGPGGAGALDTEGPGVTNTQAICGKSICCTVVYVSSAQAAGEGGAGQNGTAGTAGAGCSAPFGRFSDDVWRPSASTKGSNGSAGAGGGGGGAGSGKYMNYYTECGGATDGLGGGGGGGGAGGCGGTGGAPGRSGGPTAAMVIRDAKPNVFPVFTNVTFRGGEGGRGGDGGVGGDGGLGDPGALGTEVSWPEGASLSLSGTSRGGRGGVGGTGGAGGGGGGGCGGPSTGLWIVGNVTGAAGAATGWRSSNTFVLGHGGAAGRGGSGAAPAADGAEGSTTDVVIGP